MTLETQPKNELLNCLTHTGLCLSYKFPTYQCKIPGLSLYVSSLQFPKGCILQIHQYTILEKYIPLPLEAVYSLWSIAHHEMYWPDWDFTLHCSNNTLDCSIILVTGLKWEHIQTFSCANHLKHIQLAQLHQNVPCKRPAFCIQFSEDHFLKDS